ncbi:hypothetical protein AKJ62_01990 [candidate division MSBL1 archaeon SCGC-AAA259D14]|uniref:Uncharacterized protein n=1 Tax=candidate division MSBL1 archaeon SCGC-AAA259D14 TaxID=1698261 RepID=A0A133U6Z6_9EURY|nr:hypothetical protein AKJ62_01990 [candidate division MSBL1 archaeon SCGC-AAA259D14]
MNNEGFLLEDHPRPNYDELPSVYAQCDNLAERIQDVLTNLPENIYDSESEIIHFEAMDERDLHSLIKEDPDALVPFFTKICGLTVREFKRLHDLNFDYDTFRRWSVKLSTKKKEKFVHSIKGHLPSQISIEAGLYTFYKMWEEHQKRHRRGAKYEQEVREFFKSHEYDCEKITDPIEIDAAIPSDEPQVAMPVRTGVLRNFDKRAKEFSAENREITDKFSKAKFVVVFKIPEHELENREEVRRKLEEEHEPPGGFDEILFQDELDDFLSKLEEWDVPKKPTK